MHQQLQTAIQQKLSEHFSAIDRLQIQSIGGGSINKTYRIKGEKNFFCKLNSATKFPLLFLKEQNGLELIKKQNCIKTPVVIDCFEHEEEQILLLEWINEGERTEAFWKNFGEQLAALHRVSNDTYGLTEDNYMGSVPQQNYLHQDWINFFIHQRLQPMINRCAANSLLTSDHQRQLEKLFIHLPNIFEPVEKPCLIHGDLWSGNFMCDQKNQPVLIDPAVYYGHRSMDLAMTTLFGGFSQSFYDAYHYHFPFPKSYKEQWQVCNLYPLLIHLYLFGGSYLPQIERTLTNFT